MTDVEIMKRVFEQVYDGRESETVIENVVEKFENQIAVDPETKRAGVKRIGFILRKVSKASLPALQRASTGALLRGTIGVTFQVGSVRYREYLYDH